MITFLLSTLIVSRKLLIPLVKVARRSTHKKSHYIYLCSSSFLLFCKINKTRLEKVRDNTHLYVIVDTLENLIKGGRIGKGKGFIGSLLNIKVIANLEGGVYNPVSKVRSHKQVVNFLFKQFQADTAGKTVKAVGISHADGLVTMGNPLKALIEETGFNDVEIAFTSPIISTHTGPGAIGFIYFAE